MGIQNKILNILNLAKKTKTGISSDNLSKKAHTTKAKMYQAIFRLRKNNVKIEQKDDLYFLIDVPDTYKDARHYKKSINKKSGDTSNKPPQSSCSEDISILNFSMKMMQKEICILPEEDKIHYATYMKKATFYRNCASELLRCHKMMETLSPVSLE